jgi:penicillin-binding protein 1A
MASGMQSIANEGVHHEPYFIERVDDSAGRRLYTHQSAGERVLDRSAALTTIDTMKATLTDGTARRELAEFAQRIPAGGKTGTQQSNYTAWFVGASTYLSTAVMVRDPDRYTSMVNIPEFVEAGVPRVQGGTFPARIWGAYMQPAHSGITITDWTAPPPLAGPAERLYLPGTECASIVIGYETPVTTTLPDALVVEPEPEPSEPVPILEEITTDTTIPAGVIDPYAELPSVPADAYVVPCE